MAKFGPDGATQIYLKYLAGSEDDRVAALAVDSNGAAYVTGTTQSSDFPVTAGAYSTTLYVPPGALASGQAFAVKLDPLGQVRYSTFLGGHSPTTGVDIVVDASGDAIVSGLSSPGPGLLNDATLDPAGFPTTPGAVDNSTYSFAAGYALKLDPAGANLLFAERGLGGHLALDSQGNIYIAGAAQGPSEAEATEQYGPEPVPITSGAFQTWPSYNYCVTRQFVGLPCFYQYVAKIDGSGTKLIYSTYVTGSYGATPAGIAVDGQGDVILAGITGSPDYPTTPGSLVEQYPFPSPIAFAAAATGYLTMLNQDGSGLLFSTYLSGSEGDFVTAIVSSGESIYVAGYADSPDFPGLSAVPPQCGPPQFYVTMMDYAGGLLRTQLVDVPLLDQYGVPAGLIAIDANQRILWTGNAPAIERIDLSAPARLACVRDAADLSSASTVVPGELVSLFGNGFAPHEQQADGYRADTVIVTFDGIPAPILYQSPEQINIQVPNEIAGKSQVTMTITTASFGAPASSQVTESRTLPVTPINPAIFTGSDTHTVALNGDGTLNLRQNPAQPGSLVSIFLTGLGITNPLLPAGTVNLSPIPLNLSVVTNWGPVASAIAAVGAYSGVWQIQVRLTPGNDYPWSVMVGGHPARDDVNLWVSQ